MKQLSFSDMELSINRSKKTRSEVQLNKINQIVNWQDIARLLSETDKTGKQGGRKPISVSARKRVLEKFSEKVVASDLLELYSTL